MKNGSAILGFIGVALIVVVAVCRFGVNPQPISAIPLDMRSVLSNGPRLLIVFERHGRTHQQAGLSDAPSSEDIRRVCSDLPYAAGWHSKRVGSRTDVIMTIVTINGKAVGGDVGPGEMPIYEYDTKLGEIGHGSEWCYLPLRSRAILEHYYIGKE